MRTMIASQKQKAFFSELEALPDLVLGLKHAEACSVNVHTRFRLWDKAWPDGHNETLLAFIFGDAEEPPMTRSDSEPLVHVHVDWSNVKYCVVGDRTLPKIETTKELVFIGTPPAGLRAFAFYSKNTQELVDLIKRHGSTQIDLAAPA